TATWSSYAQVRRLLEAAGPLLEAHGGLAQVGTNSVADVEQPSSAVMMQNMGSLAAMFRDLSVMSSYISSILVVESREVGPTEWVVEQRFKDGFEPFRAYCELGIGLIAATPSLFGIPPADVVHEACQCDGAPACRYRVRCDVIDEQRQRADFFETRARLLAGQIESLQQTVGHLVSTDDLEQVLARIVVSAGHAVQAPSFVLAISAAEPIGRHVHGRGLRIDVADAIADELLGAGGDADAVPGRLVVDVRSARRHYGRLAAIRPDDGGFLSQERVVLQAYGRLAAVALDSAMALDDARRQTTSALALLELSTVLSQTESIEETVARVVDAIPSIIDCDQAAIVLRDDPLGPARLGAARGFGRAAETRLRGVVSLRNYLVPGVLRDLVADVGAVGSAATSIMVDGSPIGWVVVAVSSNPHRVETDDVRSRLAGLAAQASTAISNARRLGQIRHQALYDGLTGLPNRTLILDRVEQMLARSRRQRNPPAALFLDIDGFKDVNDTLGHDAGDQLLRAVATRLSGALRESDTIGRLGGDEFVILVEGVSLDAGPELVAERLLAVLSEPFVLDVGERVELTITASIGIAVGDRPSHLELLRDADVALYAAKASGKARFVVFQPEMQTAVRDRTELESDLRQALLGGQYFLVYQPIVDLRTMQVNGVEALLRWHHPVRGIVQPAGFIPVLEETSMIVDVGRWVLREACRQTAEWQQRHRPMHISVNVSAKQLDTDSFVDDVRAALESSGITPLSL
ncbi:MAG TPA: diguanylate cyclase, partial [Ilumatobacteraceae bacterium]